MWVFYSVICDHSDSARCDQDCIGICNTESNTKVEEIYNQTFRVCTYTRHFHDDVIRNKMGVHVDRMERNVYKMQFSGKKMSEIDRLEALGIAWRIVLKQSFDKPKGRLCR